MANLDLTQILERLHWKIPRGHPADAIRGGKRLVDYQDVGHAREYLDKVADILRLHSTVGGGASRGYALTASAAKYIAVGMAYDDVIRVADLKTRRDRFARINAELGIKSGQVLHLTEFMRTNFSREIRRRTRVVGAFPDGQSALNLAAARLRHVAGTERSTKRYLNIELLKDQQMRGAITA